MTKKKNKSNKKVVNKKSTGWRAPAALAFAVTFMSLADPAAAMNTRDNINEIENTNTLEKSFNSQAMNVQDDLSKGEFNNKIELSNENQGVIKQEFERHSFSLLFAYSSGFDKYNDIVCEVIDSCAEKIYKNGGKQKDLVKARYVLDDMVKDWYGKALFSLSDIGKEVVGSVLGSGLDRLVSAYNRGYDVYYQVVGELTNDGVERVIKNGEGIDGVTYVLCELNRRVVEFLDVGPEIDQFVDGVIEDVLPEFIQNSGQGDDESYDLSKKLDEVEAKIDQLEAIFQEEDEMDQKEDQEFLSELSENGREVRGIIKKAHDGLSEWGVNMYPMLVTEGLKSLPAKLDDMESQKGDVFKESLRDVIETASYCLDCLKSNIYRAAIQHVKAYGGASEDEAPKRVGELLGLGEGGDFDKLNDSLFSASVAMLDICDAIQRADVVTRSGLDIGKAVEELSGLQGLVGGYNECVASVGEKIAGMEWLRDIDDKSLEMINNLFAVLSSLGDVFKGKLEGLGKRVGL